MAETAELENFSESTWRLRGAKFEGNWLMKNGTTSRRQILCRGFRLQMKYYGQMLSSWGRLCLGKKTTYWLR